MNPMPMIPTLIIHSLPDERTIKPQSNTPQHTARLIAASVRTTRFPTSFATDLRRPSNQCELTHRNLRESVRRSISTLITVIHKATSARKQRFPTFCPVNNVTIP
ncbi:MAG: hypothetical protein ACK58T_36835, partial [Phycisphaerae bacterium]